LEENGDLGELWRNAYVALGVKELADEVLEQFVWLEKQKLKMSCLTKGLKEQEIVRIALVELPQGTASVGCGISPHWRCCH
jgi:hypothetical protein